MALIKCPECENEVSDKASICPKCGCPINNENKNINFNKKLIVKKERKSLDKKLIGKLFAAVVAVIVLITVVDAFKDNSQYDKMIKISKDNISIFLEYLPSGLNENGKIELPSEVIDQKDNVSFLGMNGSISYQKDTKYGKVISKMIWESHNFYTYEEEQEFTNLLTEYFGASPKIEYDQYGQYNSTKYYWTDETVPCVVYFYTSIRANHENDTDRIEVCWDLDAELPN